MTTAPDPFRVLCVIGARLNFMKIAPIMRAFPAESALKAFSCTPASTTTTP